MELFGEQRGFMKSGFFTKEWRAVKTDQARGLLQPPFEKPADPSATIFDLPKPDRSVIVKPDLFSCMADRKSRRRFSEKPISLEELSFLLWATQGVRQVIPGRTYRSVPSAGSRHAFETYIAATHIAGLEPGIYRYLALSHRLVQVRQREDVAKDMVGAMGGVKWVKDAAAVFIWAAVAYRSEWRYNKEAARVMLIDAGHVCQNLYLATEAIGCGTCAIGAYRQADIDNLLGLDGCEEYVVYCAPVGRPAA